MNFSEMVAENYFTTLTKMYGKDVKLVRISELANNLDAATRKGIDGLYRNDLFKPPPPPPKYIVNEVKYDTTGSSTWKPKLDKKVTKSGASQMQREWIRHNLRRDFDRSISNDILKSGYDAILTGVKKDGNEILNYLIEDELAKKIIKADF